MLVIGTEGNEGSQLTTASEKSREDVGSGDGE